MRPRGAVVLLVGNAQSTSTGSIDEARLPPRHWRLIITVVKVGEAYKASGVEFMR